MGILHGLERRLQGAFDKTFARIFGGSVQPAEVTSALQQEAASNLVSHGQTYLAPNRYVVDLGPTDAASVGDDVRQVASTFSALLTEYTRDSGWVTDGPIAVTLRQSANLHTGQFRVGSANVAGTPSYPSQHSGYDGSSAPARSAAQYPGQNQPSPAQPSYPDQQPYPNQPGYQGTPYRTPDYPEPYRGQPEYQPEYPGQQAYPPPSHEPPGYPQPAYPGQGFPATGYPPAPEPQNRPDNRPQAPHPRLVVQDGTGHAHVLQRGSNVVGRGQGIALRLADHAVSREHIDVYFDGQVAIVHDLGSTNGTTVNGSPIQTWQLADGDVIRLGQSMLIFVSQ